MYKCNVSENLACITKQHAVTQHNSNNDLRCEPCMLNCTSNTYLKFMKYEGIIPAVRHRRKLILSIARRTCMQKKKQMRLNELIHIRRK